MPAPECHLFLGQLTLYFVGWVWVISHSLDHKGPGKRGIVDALRLSCVACVLGKRDTEPGGSLRDDILFFCYGEPLRTAPRGLFAPAQRGPFHSPTFWGSPRKQELRSNSALFWAPLLILPTALKWWGSPRRQG